MTRRAVAVIAAALMVAAITGVFAAPRACACSCAPQETTEEAVQGFGTVFAGVPTRKSNQGDYDVYEFDVSAVYTGNVGETVTVSTSSIGTACGASFTLDDEVLVFSLSHDSDGTFGTNSCTPSGSTPGGGVEAATRKVYGEPHPPDPAAQTASLPGPGTPVARIVGIAAGVLVLGAVGVAGLVVWRRRRAG